MDLSYPSKLKNVQSHLKNQNISVLVGAGFSKNANGTLFPSWWELLSDMAAKINSSKFSRMFLKDFGKSAEDNPQEFKEYIKPLVAEYIEDVGFLKLASKFISYEGYREAVDVYIEEHTPYAIKEKGQNYLVVNNATGPVKVPLTEKDLIIHSKLIKLPWNNIYTTNYDNLLEFCLDEETPTELSKKISEYKAEIESIEGSLSFLREELKILDDKIEKSKIEDDLVKQNIDGSSKAETSLPTNDLFGLEAMRSSKQGELKYNRFNLERITQKLNNLERSLDQCFSVIKRSSQLAIKKNRNIVKLHGSIKETVSDEFCFDNDYSKRYIISQEDFDDYPTKHEAFTQLMRISLLQGHFCLIGFSGDDSNFLAWISWIRDIIKRGSEVLSKGQEEKIYFIDVNSNPASAQKQQFYANHRIVHIPLLHGDCLDFLEKENDIKLDAKNPSQVINSLFDYLAKIPVVNIPQIAFENIMREKCEGFWMNGLPSQGAKMDISQAKKMINEFYEIKPLKKYYRIPSVNFSYDFSKRIFLSSFSQLYELLLNDAEGLDGLFQLFIQILRDNFVPHSFIWGRAEFDLYQEASRAISPEIHSDFLILDLKDAIWRGDYKKEAELISEIEKYSSFTLMEELNYLKVLSKAMAFDFSGVEKCLTTFSFSGYWKLNVQGIDSLLQNSVLKDSIGSSQVTVQEELYTLEINSFLNGEGRDSDQKEKIKRLTHEGLKSIRSEIKYLVSELAKKPQKLAPHGEGQRIVSKGITLSNLDPRSQSLQLFGVLMENGLPLHSKDFNLISPESAYPAIIWIMPYYPMVALFFALQYNDDKYIKLLGQDFSFCKEIDEDHESILKALIMAYSGTQVNWVIKNNVLIFLAELVNVIDPEKWEYFFMEIWERKKQDGTLFNDDFRYNRAFINAGLSYCHSEINISRIIIDCLSYPENLDQNEVISALFYLANNPFLSKKAKRIRDKITNEMVNQLIISVIKDPDQLFKIGNLDIIFEPLELSLITQTISKIDYSSISNERLWKIITYYIKQDKVAQKKVIKGIIENGKLWFTGFSEEDEEGKRSLRSGKQYIELRELRRGKEGDVGLVFDKESVITIFSVLKNELQKICSFSRQDELISNFKFILQEMKWFVEDEISLLKDQEDFEEIKQLIEAKYLQQKGNLDLWDSLSSNDGTDVNWGLSELARGLYDNNSFTEHKSYLGLIMSRIQLKNVPGLAMCLSYVSQWSRDFKNNPDMKEYSESLLQILRLYRYGYPSGIEKSEVEGRLSMIASVLDFWEIRDETVIHFMELLDSSRYNSVKNLKFL